MIDDVKDELLALEIPETTEQEETSQESEEPPAKKRRVQFPSFLEICLQNRGKLHYILTVCQRKWSYTRLKSHLSSIQIPLSGGLNEGQSTLWCADVFRQSERWKCYHRKAKPSYAWTCRPTNFLVWKFPKVICMCTAFDFSSCTLYQFQYSDCMSWHVIYHDIQHHDTWHIKFSILWP